MLIGILSAEGKLPGAGAKVLDIGCGAGDLMQCLLARGFDAFGTDLEAYWLKGDARNPSPERTAARLNRLQTLQLQPYRLPYEANTFDLCVSTQVLEHVKDYPGLMAELHRVMKPGGTSLHLFPARWRLIESHVNVPFGGRFQGRGYLAFWASVGVRGVFQKGLDASEVTELNVNYLRDHTTYLSEGEIGSIAKAAGLDAKFLPRQYLCNHSNTLIRSLGRIPGFASFVCRISQQALLITKPAA